jgi:hypothetical protein
MRYNEITNEEIDRRGFLRGMLGAGALAVATGQAQAGADDMKADFEWQRMKPEELAIWKQRQSNLYQRSTRILNQLRSKVDEEDQEFVKGAKIKIHTDRTVYAWAQVGDDKVIEMDLAIFWDLSNDCIAYVLGHELGHLVINGRNGTKLEKRRTDAQNRREELECDVYGARLAYSLRYNPKKAYDNFSVEVKSWKSEGGYPGYVERARTVRQRTGIPVASVSTPEMIQHNMNAIRTFVNVANRTAQA